MLRIFLGSSALFAGIVSPDGAARVLLLLGETGQISLLASEQVIAETEHAVARKLPRALNEVRQAILKSGLLITDDPPIEAVLERLDWMKHAPDVPILTAAILLQVDFLVTHNRKHFLDDPQVAQRSGLRIGAPGDALVWVRTQLR
jgi:predicted nucleic acid-binding protein